MSGLGIAKLLGHPRRKTYRRSLPVRHIILVGLELPTFQKATNAIQLNDIPSNMKRIFLLFLSLTLLSVSSYSQQSLYGVVKSVLDGQTITISNGSTADMTIQLSSIETPDENQPFGDAVRDHLSQLLVGKNVTVRVSGIGGDVFSGQVIANGIDISQQMLRDGAGWYVGDDDSVLVPNQTEDYKANERLAKAEKLGVWSIEGLLAPSQLRKLSEWIADPIKDPRVAQAAWNSLGVSVEGVFANEVYSSSSQGNCGGQVVRVLDGDTVVISTSSGNLNVRLAGIDAPEKSQLFGIQAKEQLTNAVLGKSVSCSSTKKDRYGRTIGKLTLNGADVNLMMVETGYAWHYKEYENEQSSQDRSLYAAAEVSARNAGRGLWQTPGAIKPSDYRHDRFLALYTASGWRESSPTNSYYSNSSWSGSGNSGGGSGPVHVRSYTRNNGTVVRSHTRSRPH